MWYSGRNELGSPISISTSQKFLLPNNVRVASSGSYALGIDIRYRQLLWWHFCSDLTKYNIWIQYFFGNLTLQTIWHVYVYVCAVLRIAYSSLFGKSASILDTTIASLLNIMVYAHNLLSSVLTSGYWILQLCMLGVWTCFSHIFLWSVS